MEAEEVERYLIDPDEWGQHLPKVPAEGAKIIQQELECPSGPTGLSYVPGKGYAVLMCGQGPFIAWAEWENRSG